MEGGRILSSRVGYELKRAQHALRLRMDGELRTLGLTTPQYAALSVLREEPGLSGAALARRCFVRPQTMNRVLTNLESSGLVERLPHPEHGRILQARLTGKGEESLSRAHAAVEEVEEQMLSELSEEDRQHLLEALRRCADSLGG